jgi:hypothetical protein
MLFMFRVLILHAGAMSQCSHFGDFATYNGGRELCGRWLALMLAFWTFTSLESTYVRSGRLELSSLLLDVR